MVSFVASVPILQSSNVIYLIECARCRKQYVGEMENPVHLRMNGHRSDYYRSVPDKFIAIHFNTSGHMFEELTIMIVQQLGSAPNK